jgi:4-hydroxy-4-methyl-2-oxoglutarate aldolase
MGDITDRLGRCYSGVVHDVMRGACACTTSPSRKGVLGCVADGFVRDVDFLLAMGFQTWSRGFTPRDIVGYWLPRAVEVEIRIGDVLVAPGDYLLGDRDGLLRIPKGIVEEVVTQAETAISTESKVRTAILAGVDPQQAYLEFGKF